MKYRSYNSQRGLSLAEIIVVAGLSALLISIVGLFQRNVFYLTGFLQSSITSSQNARAILRTMAKEGRSAAQSNTGSYTLAQVLPQTLSFYSDVDNDGLKERIRYFLSGTELRKGVIKPTGNPLQYISGNEVITILIVGVRNVGQNIFDYYDTNYDGTTAALASPVPVLSVRLVKISVIIDSDPNKSPISRTYTTQISFRNLKNNL